MRASTLSWLMVRTVDPEQAVLKSGVKERAVVHISGVRLRMDSEMMTGAAHAGDRNLAFGLEYLNHFKERAQEDGLLRGCQCINRYSHDIVLRMRAFCLLPPFG